LITEPPITEPPITEPPITEPLAAEAYEPVDTSPGGPSREAPAKSRRDPLLLLFALGLIVLVGALVFLWQHPLVSPSASPVAGAAPPDQRLDALDSRLTAVEKRPAPATPAAPDLSALQARVTALEQRQAPNVAAPSLAPLEARVTALEHAMSPLAGKVDTLGTQLAADEAKLAALTRDAGQITQLADRTTRIGRIQAATAALDAGRPVGPLPDAPPALTRFATVPPPTVAALRQSFGPAAAAALDAHGNTGRLPFWQAMSDRVQAVVTVRRGDEVLVGDSAAAVIARARTALDNGDLSTASEALGELTGPPAAAMADWLARARSLVDARAALLAMAAKS
jgi:hypothetical protein